MELLKQTKLCKHFLLSRNKQYTSQKLYIHQVSLAGNLVLVSIICVLSYFLKLGTEFYCSGVCTLGVKMTYVVLVRSWLTTSLVLNNSNGFMAGAGYRRLVVI